MKIAIHAADLDHNRIDGTRVYLFNMLKNFGNLDKTDKFFIYHRDFFNHHLTPPDFNNYSIRKIPFPFLWTQTRFAFEVFIDRPDILWMPVHNIPLLRNKNTKVIVTIHDLAFKIFPKYFTNKDLFKLNKLSNMAIKNADHIIAVSHSTKNDILKFYPEIKNDKISVVYHGFDSELFQKDISQENSEIILKKYCLKAKSYLLYVGAIQPRKNLGVLIEAFEKIKEGNIDLKLVIAGSPAWKSDNIIKRINNSRFKKDIIITGNLEFEKLSAIYRNAKLFIFPSLYEGFGIPILESMASGVPVICAKNSSLTEVGGDAVLYFQTENSKDLADCIDKVMQEKSLEDKLIQKGTEHVKSFSWGKCAKETLDILISA
ncbi:MAG TPA: glycosyltransferase family 1 protein [Candidatus Moranbacteria bacterium]|nr:glycosyltransferase family 1 protein [Candidatus Moranbacteria bacterium]HRZ33713.1 glycosyltransferase family 1 protein [Candidatus Moranbacteria bacterium]